MWETRGDKIRMSHYSALLAIVFMMGYVIQFFQMVWRKRILAVGLGIQREESYRAAKELIDAIELEP